MTATTASQRLASDLAYALMRFGIWARITRRKKRATNADHAGAWYHHITISGQDNLRRFAERVGFSIPRKQQALEAQLGRPGNSNVDVVPIRGVSLRWLRTELRLPARVLGERGRRLAQRRTGVRAREAAARTSDPYRALGGASARGPAARTY